MTTAEYWQARLERKREKTAMAVFDYLFLARFERLPVDWETELARAVLSESLAFLEPPARGALAQVYEAVVLTEAVMEKLEDGATAITT